MSTYEDHQQVVEAIESVKIRDEQQNLRSKIDSLIRSIKNLSEKKIRIQFELERQQRALENKRRELKSLRSSKIKAFVSYETYLDSIQSGDLEKLDQIDQMLLRESAEALEL